jgi:hypothetical protein
MAGAVEAGDDEDRTSTVSDYHNLPLINCANSYGGDLLDSNVAPLSCEKTDKTKRISLWSPGDQILNESSQLGPFLHFFPSHSKVADAGGRQGDGTKCDRFKQIGSTTVGAFPFYC